MTVLFIGTTELLLIAGVALLIFGGKKVPELMKGLGKGVKSFKQGMKEPLDAETTTDESPEETTTENGETAETEKTDAPQTDAPVQTEASEKTKATVKTESASAKQTQLRMLEQTYQESRFGRVNIDCPGSLDGILKLLEALS